ncbi:translation initiation factor IF-2-like [Oenanthe melanoleuca]|uniref:translation initiation factor IF-2-like n=1 Tax=Oenanthe melanoleuca TaxID=2939378 RepID=UPI0024C1192E|nr:translation initiation factor IF-2-like [Oenanthe melanoleuca]
MLIGSARRAAGWPQGPALCPALAPPRPAAAPALRGPGAAAPRPPRSAARPREGLRPPARRALRRHRQLPGSGSWKPTGAGPAGGGEGRKDRTEQDIARRPPPRSAPSLPFFPPPPRTSSPNPAGDPSGALTVRPDGRRKETPAPGSGAGAPGRGRGGAGAGCAGPREAARCLRARLHTAAARWASRSGDPSTLSPSSLPLSLPPFQPSRLSRELPQLPASSASRFFQ